MSLADAFTSDGIVEMKHGEYYKLMREAAKAEMAANAVKADVPSYYINAMFTGKLEFPKFEAEEIQEATIEEAAEEWGALTTAMKNILEKGKTPEEVRRISGHICKIAETITQVRKDEIEKPQYIIKTCISGDEKEIHKDLEAMRGAVDGHIRTEMEATEQQEESEESKDGNE